MPSPKPAVIVRREFEFTPEVVTQQLRACIVGPACQLVRFNNAAEKAKGFMVTYGGVTTENHGGPSTPSLKNLVVSADSRIIPNLAVSSVLDAPSVRVFMEDALITYLDIRTAGIFTSNNTAGTSTNTLFSSSGIFDVPNNAWRGPKRAGSIPQDVEVGDIVEIYTVSASNVSTRQLITKVAGFTSTYIPSYMGVPSDSLLATTARATPTNPTGSANTTGVVFTFDTSIAYATDANRLHDHRIAGKVNATYTVTITGYTTGYVTFNVTTDTGLDQAFNVTLETTGTAYHTLPSGLKLGMQVTGTPNVVIGGIGTFQYGVGHTAYARDQSLAYTNASEVPAGRYHISGVNVSNSLPKDTIYTLTCISGGGARSNNPIVFRVTTNNGADSTSLLSFSSLTATASVEKNIGNYGLKLFVGKTIADILTPTVDNYKLGFNKGDKIIVPVVAAKEGDPLQLILADPYTNTIGTDGAIKRVRISKQKTVEIPPFQPDSTTRNWTLTNADNAELARIVVEPTVIIRDSSVQDGLTNAYVTAGKAYTQYRAFLDLPREIGSVLTLSDITTQLGTIDPENFLAYAVFKAWSNANGTIVHYIPTLRQTLNGERGFADALALATGQRNCYSLVPLSTSPEVWNAFVAHANDESAPDAGRYRIVWIAPEINRHFKIQDSAVGNADLKLFATSAAVAGQAGKWFVSIPLSTTSRFTENVRAGDWVRTDFGLDTNGFETFTEYKISSVVDNNTLVIISNTDPALVTSQIEIFRDLTPSAMAEEYVKIAGGFSSERVFAIVPNRGVNGLRVGGVPVKNWNVAAAFAGLRAGSRPHQPLSNVELLGFDGSNATVPAFNEVDLDTLRDGGIWVVMNDNEGKIYAERQLSTSTLDNFRKEQSVTCNIDSMSFSIADGLRTLVGRVNITDKNLELVRTSLTNILRGFTTSLGSETIGAQLRAYQIQEITVPTTANDTVRAKVAVTVPLPMNTIDITLVV